MPKFLSDGFFEGSSTDLTVDGKINISDYVVHKGDTSAYFGFPANDEFIVELNGGTGLDIDLPGGSFAIGDIDGTTSATRINSSGSEIDMVMQGSTIMRIGNGGNGNVGIGTTNPGVKLQVNGKTTLGDAFTPTSTEQENILNLIVGSTSAGASNGIGFYENNTGFGMKLGYDGTGAGDANALRIYNDSDSAIFTFQNGGNLGIGTTNPGYELEVIGDARFTGRVYTNANATNTVGILGKAAADGWASRYDSNNSNFSGFYFDTNNQSIIIGRNSSGTIVNYIHANASSYFIGGNIGIGTTSPSAKLHVKNGGEVLRLDDTSASGSPYMTFYQNGTRRSFIQHNDSSNTFIIASEYGPIDLKTATNGSESTRMRISATGNVGIGDTSPDAKLTVFRAESTYAVNLSDTESRAGLSVKSSSNFDSKLTISSGASSRQYIQAVNNAATTGRDIVLNPYGGSVGIGATSPETRFHVFQNANVGGSAGNFEKLRTLQNSGGSGGNNVYVREWGYRTSSGTTWTTWSYHNGISVDSSYGTPLWNTKTFWHREPYADKQYFGGGSNKVLTIQGGGGTNRVGINDDTPSYELDVSGTIRATGDVIAYSDIRVKENIITIENALDKVKKLRGVEYNKIDNPERSIGVIAQEIEGVIPEVVKEDDGGMKSVAYGNITAVLIEAIKEQQKQIDELKNQLDGYTK